jgi:hypothetical protein
MTYLLNLLLAGQIVSVIEALTRLKDELPGAEEKQFAKIHKSGDTSIVVAMWSARCSHVHTFWKAARTSSAAGGT